MRDLRDKTIGQAIVDGFRIYYNFIRPRMALNGETPAEKSGLEKVQELIGNDTDKD